MIRESYQLGVYFWFLIFVTSQIRVRVPFLRLEPTKREKGTRGLPRSTTSKPASVSASTVESKICSGLDARSSGLWQS